MSRHHPGLERNLVLYATWSAFRSGLFWLPIFMIYYLSFDLKYTAIMWLPVITGVVQLLLEVPSGVFADLVGRKYAVILSSVLWSAQFYTLLLADSFTGFAIAAVFFGASLAFASGSDTALLYDTLKALDRTSEYKRWRGRALGYRWVGMAFGGLTGGFLAATYGLQAPLVAVFGVSVLIAFFPIFFHEPPHFRSVADRKFFHHLSAAVRFTAKDPRVRALAMYGGLFATIMVVSHKYIQPYLLESGVGLEWFGLVYFVWLGFCALAALRAEWFEGFLGEKGSLWFIPLALIANFAFLGWYKGLLVVVVTVLSEFTWGYSFPVVEGYMHDHVESHHRATVMSLQGFLMSLGILVFAPLTGLVADAWGLQVTFFVLTAVTVLVSIGVLPGLVGRRLGSR